MLQGVLTVLKALPVIAQAIGLILAAIEKNREARIKKHYEDKAIVRKGLTEKIKGATTDEERKRLIEQLDSIG